MRILIDCNNRLEKDSYADNIYYLLLYLFSKQNYLITKTTSASEAGKALITDEHVLIINREPKALLSFINNNRLSFLLKKQKIDLLIQIDRHHIVRTPLPQILILNNIENLKAKKGAALNALLVLPSLFAKQKAQDIHELADETIEVIPAAADGIFKPLLWNEKRDIKEKYTEGEEFFFVLAKHETKASFLSLLKAFSVFKKWQRSSMKLVVVGELSFALNDDWVEKLNSYKFRNDIVFLKQTSNAEYAGLLASAYVFIHTPKQDDDIVQLLEAMQCATPSICFSTESTSEYAGDAALLIEQDNYDQLSEKMILLYKDEKLRSRLAEACVNQSHLYSKEKVMLLLQQAVAECMNKQTKI